MIPVTSYFSFPKSGKIVMCLELNQLFPYAISYASDKKKPYSFMYLDISESKRPILKVILFFL